MNSQELYSKIEGIQKQLVSTNNDQLYQELQRFVLLEQWQSPLIYGGLYIKQKGIASVTTFFARKTIEAIEKLCECRTTNHNEIAMGSRSVNEEKLLAKKQLDQLLVAMTFLVFLFDKTVLREAIEKVQQNIQRKIRRSTGRFIDQVPLNDYLSILKIRYQKNEKTFQTLNTFFDELIKNAGLHEMAAVEQRTVNLKECIEFLIEEVGRKIEKPDRIFSIADSLGIISKYAESLFDFDGEGGERFFNKFKWAYPRGRAFNDLNVFWTACMIGLYTLNQALDRFPSMAQVKEQAKIETMSTKINNKDISNFNSGVEENTHQQKQHIIRNVERNVIRAPVLQFMGNTEPLAKDERGMHCPVCLQFTGGKYNK